MKNILIFTLAAVGLSACGGFVASKKAPDEMAVIAGPSLSLPPNFELRPPTDAAEYHRQQKADRARQILTGTPHETKTPVAGPDAWLVKEAGGDTRDPSIRNKLETDHVVETEEKSKGWLTRQKEVFFGAEEDESINK